MTTCVLALVATTLAISFATPARTPQSITQPGPLVLVSMPGLSWDQVSPTRTPTLWRLAKRGAVAAQATYVMTAHSCSNTTWLTFSAGARTAYGHPKTEAEQPAPEHEGPPTCRKLRVPQPFAQGSAIFYHWGFWHEYARTGERVTSMGKVARTLEEGGQCVAAAGGAAAIGAANGRGVIAPYSPDPENVDLQTCPVTFIGLDGPDDQYLGRLLQRLPPRTTVVVSGMADESGPSTLHTLVVAGPGVPHGVLTSDATRQPGFVATPDLAPLVTSRLGAAAPAYSEGRMPVVLPVHGATAGISQVSQLAHALDVEYAFVPLFFGLFLGGGALALAVGALGLLVLRRGQALRGEPRRAPPALRWWFAVVGAMCAAMPMATFLVGLVPWWRAAHPRLALSLGIVAISAAASALALLGPWRRWSVGPMTFMATLTFVVIAEDVMHGSRLQLISLMGLQPVYATRYYGQGNVGYAVFATVALLVAAVLAGRLVAAGHRRLAAATVVLVGLAAVVIDGLPSWGADAGGPLALMPAIAYLALSAAGVALTWRRAAVIVVASLAVVCGFAVLDYLRPPGSRTHLGITVAQLREGRFTALTKIFTLNWAMLTASWLNMTVVILLVALVVALLVPGVLGRRVHSLLGREPHLGQGMAAIVVCWLLAFFANDSGTGIPPTGLLVVVPLLVMLAAAPHPGYRRRRPSAQETESVGQLKGKGSETIDTALARAAVSRRRWCWRQSTS